MFKKKLKDEEKQFQIEKYSKQDPDTINESLLQKMNRGPVTKVWEKVMKLWTVLNDPNSDKAKKALAIGALIYLVSPLDLIPDMVPVLGLTDDVSIIAYAVAQLANMKKK